MAPATTTVGADAASSAPEAGRASDRVAVAVARPNARRETAETPEKTDDSPSASVADRAAEAGGTARGEGTNAAEGATSRAANARIIDDFVMVARNITRGTPRQTRGQTKRRRHAQRSSYTSELFRPGGLDDGQLIGLGFP